MIILCEIAGALLFCLLTSVIGRYLFGPGFEEGIYSQTNYGFVTGLLFFPFMNSIVIIYDYLETKSNAEGFGEESDVE